MKLVDNASIGRKKSLAFVDWRDDSKPNGMDGGLREIEDDLFSAKDRDYGADIRDTRVKNDRSIREVARRLGLSPSRYCDIERGKARPATPEDEQELRAALAAEVTP